jgi:hypothetical protein
MLFSLIIGLTLLRLFFNDILIDEFGIVDEESCHLLLEKLDAAHIVIVLIRQ